MGSDVGQVVVHSGPELVHGDLAVCGLNGGGEQAEDVLLDAGKRLLDHVDQHVLVGSQSDASDVNKRALPVRTRSIGVRPVKHLSAHANDAFVHQVSECLTRIRIREWMCAADRDADDSHEYDGL